MSEGRVRSETPTYRNSLKEPLPSGNLRASDAEPNLISATWSKAAHGSPNGLHNWQWVGIQSNANFDELHQVDATVAVFELGDV